MEELKTLFWCMVFAAVVVGLLRNCGKASTEQRGINSYNPNASIRLPFNDGTCDCPYDYALDGRRCQDMSAWSRPGGRQPECYFGDRYGYPHSR